MPTLSLASIKLIAFVVYSLVLVGSTTIIKGKVDASTLAQWKAAQEHQASLDNAKAAAELKSFLDLSSKATAEAQSLATKRQATIDALRINIAKAPSTKACADSPAIRGLLDGLRLNATTPNGK